MWVISKEFCFEAAHRLPNLPPEHKCSWLHGHSFRFRLHVTGELDPLLGWVTDFGGLLKAAGNMIVQSLDHRCLNDVEGLENPTSEMLALWIYKQVKLTQLDIVAVEVSETCGTSVRYDPPGAV